MSLPARLPMTLVPQLTAPGAGSLLWLSSVIGVLFLTGPIFMMQVYDRVLSSGSAATLVGLTLIMALAYLGYGVFDAVRAQISAVRAEEFAAAHDGAAFAASVEAAAAGVADARTQAPEDVETVRQFLGAPGYVALFDLPTLPIYFVAVALLHPLLGFTVLVAGALLAGLAVLNERFSRDSAMRGQAGLAASGRVLFGARREAESLKGNGMIADAAAYWRGKFAEARRGQFDGARTSNLFGSITKTLRLAIQSGVLAIGAWLCLRGELSAGAIIAASVVFSRALSPIEQVLTSWRQMLRAREAMNRIALWNGKDAKAAAFDLPAPRASLEAKSLAVCAPGQRTLLVRDVNFSLKASDVLAIVGASGAGKSSLARTLIGAWPAAGGALELDGADLKQWPADWAGQHGGYLPQNSDFIEGSVAAIISRYRSDASERAILSAARAAGAHELILTLPDGYATHIGPGGIQLSGGQRQRIGLARALYGNPFVAVLDEPAAHLDRAGEAALAQAIEQRRAGGRITIFTSHDQRLIRYATHIVALDGGKMIISGPRQAVLDRLSGRPAETTLP